MAIQRQKKQSRSIPERVLKLLCLKSGNVCAFPGCGRPLVKEATGADGAVVLAEAAHIVAFSPQGPRGSEQLDGDDRNTEDNLLLVCGDHHTIFDAQPNTYSAAVLRQMKADHEKRIRALTSDPVALPTRPSVRDELHSTLLAVTRVPQFVFVAPSEYADGEERQVAERIHYPANRAELVPFLIRDGHRLYAFHNLHVEQGPFKLVVDWAGADRLGTAEFCTTDEGRRRFVTLLNKALTKHLAALGVRFDPDHRRFYFLPETPGKERCVRYRPLAASSTTRKIVWQPIRKATGEPKGHWVHLACGLKFVQMGPLQWALTIRPEFHFTSDGKTPLPPAQIGRRATRLKSRMYNFDYLGEVQFWRDFMSRGSPRVILNFGQQSAVISTTLITCHVEWPGIPGDTKAFKNIAYEDDLFTLADLEDATIGEGLDWEFDEGEEDEADDDEW